MQRLTHTAMIPPAKPPDEQQRLEALDKLQLLHTDYEQRFDRITLMATRIFNVPIAYIALIASDEQWFKSCIGMDITSTPRDVSFCGHAILTPKTMVVPDATKDERFHDNPMVIGPPFVRFYAGRPLAAANGQRIGTLCIVDTKPREMSLEDLKNLDDLAIWVEREMNQFGAESGGLKEIIAPSNR
jgi:GAF domain-containing protein